MNADDRGGGRRERLDGWLEALGGFGSLVFFGCLLLLDDGDKAPHWVFVPAFVAP